MDWTGWKRCSTLQPELQLFTWLHKSNKFPCTAHDNALTQPESTGDSVSSTSRCGDGAAFTVVVDVCSLDVWRQRNRRKNGHIPTVQCAQSGLHPKDIPAWGRAYNSCIGSNALVQYRSLMAFLLSHIHVLILTWTNLGSATLIWTAIFKANFYCFGI